LIPVYRGTRMEETLAIAKKRLQEHTQKKAKAEALAKAAQKIEIGRVLAVGSSVATVSINKKIISKNLLHLAQLGSVLKIVTRDSIVVAMVGSLEVAGVDDEGMHDGCIAKLNILRPHERFAFETFRHYRLNWFR